MQFSKLRFRDKWIQILSNDSSTENRWHESHTRNFKIKFEKECLKNAKIKANSNETNNWKWLEIYLDQENKFRIIHKAYKWIAYLYDFW